MSFWILDTNSIMDPDQLNEICNEYSGDGENLTKQQAYMALISADKDPSGFEISQFFQECGVADDDEEGTISYEQFQELYNRIGERSVEAMKAALDTFDRDGSGYIDREELKEILRMSVNTTGFETMLDDESVDEILQKTDLEHGNSDGRVNTQELAEFIISGQGI